MSRQEIVAKTREKTIKGLTSTKNIAIAALMAAIMCIVGPMAIPLPFTLVPISLTNFVIYLSAFVLTWKYCSMSYVVYMLLGLAGLPVFSGGGSGIAKIAGPTGGYLAGFVFTAIICSLINEKFSGKICMYILGMVIGLTVAYLFGIIWFCLQQNMGFLPALSLCVVPFLAGDAVKIAAAVIIGPALKRAVNSIRR